jgi:hypothetical protein
MYRLSGVMMRLAPSGDVLGRIGRLLEEGTIRPDVASVYALQDAAQAWKDIVGNLPRVHGMSPSGPGAAISIDIAVDTVAAQNGEGSFFNDWMRACPRRLVMAKALAAVRVKLAESARRTRRAKLASPLVLVALSLSPSATKAQIEEALLAIDIFPRTVVVLCLLEGIRTADAAIGS